MRFQVGDLVKAPSSSTGESILAIVVMVDKANSSSLLSSIHSSSMVANSLDLYYVFSDALSGPYFTSELTELN